MARKTLTKQQRINRQYREQIRRIERNYKDIELHGGSFSQSVNEIIKPVAKPTEATIRRLRKISKDALYRMARTETGETGWKIKVERQEYSALKASNTRFKTKLAKEKVGDYFNYYTKKEKAQVREEAYEEWAWKHGYRGRNNEHRIPDLDEDYYDSTEDIYAGTAIEEDTIHEYEEDIKETSQDLGWTSEREPTYYDAGEIELEDEYAKEYEDQRNDISIPSPSYTPEPIYSADTIPSGNEEAFYFALDDVIETNLSEHQDKSYARALLNEYEELKERLNTDEFLQWMKKNGRDFSKLVEEVVNYEPSVLDKGNQLNKFNQAMNKLNDGVTPLDKFNSYYEAPDEYDEEYYEDDEEDEEYEYVDLLDTTDGEIIKGKQETYISKIDKWGKEYYSTRWVDEYGMTLDVGYKTSHYVPVSQIKNIEDYLR